MYLWRRRVTPLWLEANEPQLEDIAPGAVVIIIQPRRLQGLVQVTCKTERHASRLVRRFQGSVERLANDFVSQRAASRPIRIGKRLLIVAQPSTSDRPKELVIPAAGAFGTGEHATTAMCLRLLEETSRGFSLGWRMLDAGAGTGILALAASRFGARQVLAIDYDPRALAHARCNARLNRIRNVKFVRQDFLRWKPDARYDVIAANLFSEMLIAALPIFRRALGGHGRLILSGILREQAELVQHSLGKSSFRLEKLRRRGKWIALLAARA